MTESAETPERGWFHRFYKHAELWATILLAMAAVATAWSSYQSARWSGIQAINFSKANAARVESSRLSTIAGQETQVDVLTFTQWVDARADGEKELEQFYFDRFRPEFKPAMDAWLATDPLNDPTAPPTPFAMTEYDLEETRESHVQRMRAEASTAEALESNQRSDNYVLAVVLFASSLFFAGVSTKLNAPGQRVGVLFLGYFIFIGTGLWVATFPITVSL